MKENMLSFLSENTCRLHKEYLNTQKLRFSILTKSEPRLLGLDVCEIRVARAIPQDIREEAITALSEIRAHELYFNSFAPCGTRSPYVKEKYGSESSFLYSILCDVKHFGEGFCFIVKHGGDIFAKNTKFPAEIYMNMKTTPLLCVDLYEHAYFCDYGFEKEEYLAAALSHLDLSKLF